MRLPSRSPLGHCAVGLVGGLLVGGAASELQAQAEPRTPQTEAVGAQAMSQAALTGRIPTPEELGLVPGRPRVTPTRTDTPPVLDGVLDDEVWRTAAHLTEFTQQSPIEGAAGTEATDVYIAYDSDNIYFGLHAHYEDPSIMRANRVERDRASMDDLLNHLLRHLPGSATGI